MPGTFRFLQLRKSPRRHWGQVLSWPPCQPTPARCPFFHSETPAPTASIDAHHFMSGNARILNSGPGAFFREHVTVANTTGLHLDPHLSCTRLRNLTLNDFEICSGLRDLCHLHCCHRYSHRCHKCSYQFSVVE